ncbi:GIN domain-containing protein [Geofilum rhodophaeum]|uniref:GIN domain-containing protein n=1 Tax=Geofilum rhodophaeum TaxID=1965019 RepID=UPI000B520512|nr:DUF2807 domain-containing protein [Geofilum rhodophaeum]
MVVNSYRFVFGGILLLMLASCEGILNIEVVGDGKSAEPQERVHAAFTSIEFYDDFTLQLKPGDQQQVQVQADANLLAYIHTEVLRGTLLIRRLPNYTLIPREPVVITVTTSRLDLLEVFGDGWVNIDSLQTDLSDIKVYARARVKARGVEADHLKVLSNGGGVIDLEGGFGELQLRQVGSGSLLVRGHADKARLIQEGSGKIEAGDLAADYLNVGLNGSGLVYCRSLSFLGIEITGSGRVFYRGAIPAEVKAPANQVGTY